MNDQVAEALDAVRDDLLVARIAVERDDFESVIDLLGKASRRLSETIDVLRLEPSKADAA